MLQEDKITIPLLPIKRTPAIEGWKFSHPCKCTRRRNNNPLRQRFIFGVRLWEEQHGVVVEGGGETEYKGVCSHVHNIHIFLGKSPQLSIRLFILKKKKNSNSRHSFHKYYWQPSYTQSVSEALRIWPWLRKMYSGHLLTNEKDIFNKNLKIQNELLMRNKIQCCWSIL